MARKTATTTTTTKTTTTEARRLQSLTPKQGRQLSSLEESVVRMHHGVSIRAEAELATNAVSADLQNELLDREVDAHIATGRAEELPDVPADERTTKKKPVGNQKSQKLIAHLKKA